MSGSVTVTFYAATGYNPSDEPANDAVIDQNEHWNMPYSIKEHDPGNLTAIKVLLTDAEVERIDFVKVYDPAINQRWYYYVAGHQRVNERVVQIRLVLDAFATVGLANIAFYGNIARRSLSQSEKAAYPLLPEPWAPRRPLKMRRMILDLNVSKTIKLPTHITTTFEETATSIEKTPEPIKVPRSPLGLTYDEDSLSISTSLPMGYPNAAGDTDHSITTPWGTISYTTPYEEYLTLSGNALNKFLEYAKKYNALDLVEAPYYLPAPQATQTITLTELSNPATRNPKASRHYTTVTIRALASNASRTFADSDTDLKYNQPLSVIIAPDKHGGIYVLPSTLRETGLNAYTYLEGVYSPFETVLYNAVGDTPAKFASDGTIQLNTALNDLYHEYTKKINAMQYEGMQAKYFKDVGVVKGGVMAFASELLGSTSETITTTAEYVQEAIISTIIPRVTQNSYQTQNVPQYTQTQDQSSTTNAHTTKQSAVSKTPEIKSEQNSITSNPSVTSTQDSYSYYSPGGDYGGTVAMPFITTRTAEHTTTTESETTQEAHDVHIDTTINTPNVNQTMSGSVTTPAHSIDVTSQTITDEYAQNTVQQTTIPQQVTHSQTTQNGAGRSVSEGNQIALDGIDTVYSPHDDSGTVTWKTLGNMIFGGYRNEVHSFMLGNINDYLNRWVSIQNDIHNGKVANLFKNITLVGNYNDYNKLAGKYEIIIASLAPEDEINFDLFLEHFGHAVDEYTDTLVTDVRDNYNYTMVGEDAILTNSVRPDANARILNQFRTGVRVWKKPIRPGNY